MGSGFPASSGLQATQVQAIPPPYARCAPSRELGGGSADRGSPSLAPSALLRAPAPQPAPSCSFVPGGRPPLRDSGPTPPLRDWPPGPPVGGAPDRGGAVYSKGRACAAANSSARGRRARAGPAVRRCALSIGFFLPLTVSAEVTGGGGPTRPQGQRERQPGSRSPCALKARGVRGGLESRRAAARPP